VGHRYVTRETLIEFVRRVDAAFARPGSLYMIGETTHLFEGWREWTSQIEVTATVAGPDRPRFVSICEDVGEQLGVEAIDEFPGDVIPLPYGFDERTRPAGSGAGLTRHLRLYHFDPCSVAFRFIARGEEPDYHLVLMYLERSWLTVEEMDARLAELLPRFTARTIQQDPAEFRRKYDGLLQMWRAVRARTTHRTSAV
jgi:hypothetical protein